LLRFNHVAGSTANERGHGVIYVLGEERVELEGEEWYVAPSAQVIGRVRLGRGASVWFNAVLRGDSDWITIGAGTNVQDGAIVHANEGEPTNVGRDVTIGHMAFLHACDVGDESMIANGAMVLDRAHIGARCIVAAGTLVPPGKDVPDGSVVMGSPGKIVRQTTPADLEMIRRAGEIYRARARKYRAELRIDARSASPSA
jgi:carbonic anhydrase/acetyltransferase-like protein (isoleucine patch superfamily)